MSAVIHKLSQYRNLPDHKARISRSRKRLYYLGTHSYSGCLATLGALSTGLKGLVRGMSGSFTAQQKATVDQKYFTEFSAVSNFSSTLTKCSLR
jgi:hypothetical protein